ncbi:hypothetical protein ONZ45_g10065 [Pleurotus djamor]|nr:hypothetical protein ONZ45_g10065 [Pleurotus djamor]
MDSGVTEHLMLPRSGWRAFSSTSLVVKATSHTIMPPPRVRDNLWTICVLDFRSHYKHTPQPLVKWLELLFKRDLRAPRQNSEVLIKFFFEASVKLDGRVDYAVLLNIGLACKSWYRLIKDTPELWTDLSDTSDARTLAARLSHTSHAPLKYSGTQNPTPLSSRSICDLFKELDRTRILKSWLDFEGFVQHASKLEVEAPLLESLELLLPLSSPIFTERVTNWFGGVKPPRLQSLRLRGIQLPWSSPLLKDLTCLNLDAQIRPAIYPIFNKILSQMPLLTDLSIGNCLPRDVSSYNTDSRLYLPSLVRLAVADFAPLSTAFLTCLEASPRYVSVFGVFHSSHVPPMLDECSRLLSPFLNSKSPCSCLKIKVNEGRAEMDYSVDVKGIAPSDLGGLQDVFHIKILLPKRFSSPLDVRSSVTNVIRHLPVRAVGTLELSASRPVTWINSNTLWSEVVPQELKKIYELVVDIYVMISFISMYTVYLRERIRHLEEGTGENNAAQQLFDGLQRVVCHKASFLAPSINDINSLRSSLGLPTLSVELDA